MPFCVSKWTWAKRVAHGFGIDVFRGVPGHVVGADGADTLFRRPERTGFADARCLQIRFLVVPERVVPGAHREHVPFSMATFWALAQAINSSAPMLWSVGSGVWPFVATSGSSRASPGGNVFDAELVETGGIYRCWRNDIAKDFQATRLMATGVDVGPGVFHHGQDTRRRRSVVQCTAG